MMMYWAQTPTEKSYSEQGRHTSKRKKRKEKEKKIEIRIRRSREWVSWPILLTFLLNPPYPLFTPFHLYLVILCFLFHFTVLHRSSFLIFYLSLLGNNGKIWKYKFLNWSSKGKFLFIYLRANFYTFLL